MREREEEWGETERKRGGRTTERGEGGDKNEHTLIRQEILLSMQYNSYTERIHFEADAVVA